MLLSSMSMKVFDRMRTRGLIHERTAGEGAWMAGEGKARAPSRGECERGREIREQGVQWGSSDLEDESGVGSAADSLTMGQ